MIDQIREFITLSSKMSYTAASRALNISQPTLSRHIAQLEAALGFRLFERNPLSLTPAGSQFLAHASDIIERFDVAVRQGRETEAANDLTLTICMLSSDQPYSRVVYDAVSEMRKSLPGFTPRFHSDRRHSVCEAVAAGIADIGVTLAPQEDASGSLRCEWLVDTPFFAWLHKDSPAARTSAGRPIPFESISGYALVCSTHRQYLTWYDGMVAACRKHGVSPKTRMKDMGDVESFLVDLQPDEVVFGSGTAGSLPAPSNPNVIPVEFNDPGLHYSAYLLYRKDARPIVRRFAAVCHGVAQTRGR